MTPRPRTTSLVVADLLVAALVAYPLWAELGPFLESGGGYLEWFVTLTSPVVLVVGGVLGFAQGRLARGGRLGWLLAVGTWALVGAAAYLGVELVTQRLDELEAGTGFGRDAALAELAPTVLIHWAALTAGALVGLLMARVGDQRPAGTWAGTWPIAGLTVVGGLAGAYLLRDAALPLGTAQPRPDLAPRLAEVLPFVLTAGVVLGVVQGVLVRGGIVRRVLAGAVGAAVGYGVFALLSAAVQWARVSLVADAIGYADPTEADLRLGLVAWGTFVGAALVALVLVWLSGRRSGSVAPQGEPEVEREGDRKTEDAAIDAPVS